MGLGVLDVQSPEAVPGTTYLEHIEGGTAVDETLSHLKHAKGRVKMAQLWGEKDQGRKVKTKILTSNA